jgi:hypothetical protein
MMSKAAVSMLAFGIYLAIGGFLLVLFPEFVCQLFALDQPQGVWVRLTGMFFCILAFYSIVAARREMTAFIRLTVYARPATLVFLGGFVVAGLTQPVMLIFGAVDVAASFWTALALQADARAARSGVRESRGKGHTSR